MRIVRFACGLALLAGTLLYRPDGAGAQGSQEQRQACAPDAVRLCSEFIPDVPKITACMKKKHAELSDDCRVAMDAGKHERGRHEAHRHRAARARGHCDKFTHLCS